MSPTPRILPCRRVAVCKLNGRSSAAAAAQNGLVFGLIVAPVLERILRDHRSGQAKTGSPLQLPDRVRDVVKVDHRDALEAGGIARPRTP